MATVEGAIVISGLYFESGKLAQQLQVGLLPFRPFPGQPPLGITWAMTLRDICCHDSATKMEGVSGMNIFMQIADSSRSSSLWNLLIETGDHGLDSGV